MAFTFSLNNLYASQQECLYRFKEKLIAAGWVVKDSGTGTGAVYGAGTDVITTFSTTTDAVAGAITNRSAWFRIQSPDTVRELLVYHSPINTATDVISIRYSPSAQFIGTGDGAHSATVAPTATDNFMILGTLRSTALGTGTSWCNGNTGNFRMDFIMGGAAENYAFYAAMRTSGGTGQYIGGLLFDRLVNTVASDPDPTVVWGISNAGLQAFATNSGRLQDQRSNWTYAATTADGTAITTHFPWGVPVLNSPRTDAANSWSIPTPCRQVSASSVMNPTGSNPYDAKIDLLEPCHWACINTTPSFATGSLGSPQPYGIVKGDSQIIKAISTTTGFNNMDTNAELTRVVQPGGFWLLWDGIQGVGATPGITNPSGTTFRVTVATSTFVAGDVGKTIRITGATTAANNGTFVVTAQAGTTIDYTNASGAVEAYTGTWYLYTIPVL